AGIATVGSWTLGATAGTNTLTATSTGLSGNPVTFTATGTAPPPASISVNAGDGQTVAAGSALPTAPSVVVKDANGNPLAGVTVTFTIGSGGGSVTGATAVTDASGIATVGSWTLGTTPGANSLTATVGSLNVTFTATGS
ncbi:MAG: Ig-like domain-containing protein, partial [bacterium]